MKTRWITTGAMLVLAVAANAANAGQWRESESSYVGTFQGTWECDNRGLPVSGRWNNGAVADLRVEFHDGNKIVIFRSDPAGVSRGLRGRYVGYRNGNGFRGTAYNIDRNGNEKAVGTWSANW